RSSDLEAVRGILDRDMREAAALGVQRRLAGGRRVELRGSGKAFPQTPNAEGEKFLRDVIREGLSNPRVLREAQRAVQRGEAESLEDALAQYRELWGNLRGVHGYFERTRVELPEEFVEWNPNRVLPSLIERNALFVEGVREWGVNFDRARGRIERLRAERGSAVADPIEDFFTYEFGARRVNPDDAGVAQAISNFETVTKLGLSP